MVNTKQNKIIHKHVLYNLGKVGIFSLKFPDNFLYLQYEKLKLKIHTLPQTEIALLLSILACISDIILYSYTSQQNGIHALLIVNIIFFSLLMLFLRCFSGFFKQTHKQKPKIISSIIFLFRILLTF